ncbi:YbjN domain-containing protein [Streptomyces neyagawaensis]|uniref:YbjN domain-containing protein n=1 Tax=Streptomyces neyagawaensis TaxID=42238 RepID=A0ABV3BA94_9ACTN
MTADPLVPLSDGWEALARTWARRRGARVTAEHGALSVDIAAGAAVGAHDGGGQGPAGQGPGPALVVDFNQAGGTVVVIVTDGTLVPPDRVAPTAAAATAWNAREVTPTAVLGYDRTELPLLSAVSTLPLPAHMTPAGFDATLDAVLERAARLLTECRDLGHTLRSADDLAARG